MYIISWKKGTFITAINSSSLPKKGVVFSPVSVKRVSFQCQRSSMRIHSDRESSALELQPNSTNNV